MVPNSPFFYTLKTSENITVFWCFHRVERGCIGSKWVEKLFTIHTTISKRTLNCDNFIKIKLITWLSLRLGLSHLQDHKFKHNFLDCLNTICCSVNEIEATAYYVLRCPISSKERSIFLKNIQSIDENILSESDSRIPQTLLFGIFSFNVTTNASFLNRYHNWLYSTKRFDVPLTNSWFLLNHLCIETCLPHFTIKMSIIY